MFASIRFRLWFTYALLVGFVLCVLIGWLAIYLVRNPTGNQQAYTRLNRTIEVLLPRMANIPSAERAQTAAEDAGALLDVRIFVLNPEREVLVDSHRSRSAPRIVFTDQNLTPRRGTVVDVGGNTWLYAMRRAQGGNTLMVATPRSANPATAFALRLREVVREDLLPTLMRAGIFALILALLLAYWMARWIAAPLRRIANASEGIASGSYESIPIEGPKEVQALAAAFNEMADRVESSNRAQRDFIANVSHELKTPLTSIQGFSQAILDGTAGSTKVLQQSARVIHDEADRMYRMVMDLLDLARMDSGTANFSFISVDISTLLKDVQFKLTPQAQEAKVDIRLELEDALTIPGDPDRLTQVFSNLIENSIKSSPEGGEITIQAKESGDRVEISIADNGTGIPAEDLQRIFERFYRVDPSRQGGKGYGVGLGLSIAQGIVKAHGGTIQASHRNPQGSEFIVRLPGKNLNPPPNSLNPNLR